MRGVTLGLVRLFAIASLLPLLALALSACSSSSSGSSGSGAGGSSNTEPPAMMGMTAAHNMARAGVKPPADPPIPPLAWSGVVADSSFHLIPGTWSFRKSNRCSIAL